MCCKQRQRRKSMTGAALTAAFGLAVTPLFGVGTAAGAQSTIEPPKPYSPTDLRGVNLSDGTLFVSTSTISIGPAVGGLSFSAGYDTAATAWRHSVFGGIQFIRYPAPFNAQGYFSVTVMGQSAVFTKESGGAGYIRWDGLGELSRVGDIWTYVGPDGTIATFDKALAPGMNGTASQGPVTSITRPNGERMVFAYTASTPVTPHRLQSVTNNLGYQLHFHYPSETPSGNERVQTVTALNNAVDACAPTANTCAFSQTWPSLTWSSEGHQVTDALGRTLRLIFTGSDLTGIARPRLTSGQNDTLTWNAAVGSRPATVATYSNGAGAWSYDYGPTPIDPPPYGRTTTVTDSLLQTEKYGFSYTDDEGLGRVNVALYGITDGFNQITGVDQDAAGLHSVIYPEGNAIQYLSDDYGNPAGSVAYPKGGGAAIEVVAAFVDCSTLIRCRRPSSITDARGGVTDYTYDAAGNLLTETGPAPTPGAARPQTRYTWEQRYAWYKQNGSSAITQAPSPVWVQTGSSQCMTGATC